MNIVKKNINGLAKMILNICKELEWGSRESVLFTNSVLHVNKTPARVRKKEGENNKK